MIAHVMKNKPAGSFKELRKSQAFRAESVVRDFIKYCENKRQEEKLSYSDIAKKMGVSMSRVHHIMHYEYSFTVYTLVRFADAMGVKLSDALNPAIADRKIPVKAAGAKVKTVPRKTAKPVLKKKLKTAPRKTAKPAPPKKRTGKK